MAVYESVLDAIGDTPLIRLRRISEGTAVPIYVKAEFFNPGGSVKDRAALAMVRAAEQSGDLRPGGVIVEGTSGNTGVGLAMVAAQLGYRLVVVVPDKSSDEKLAILRAHGAELIVTDGDLPREDPQHVNALAQRLASEIPGAWFANQYDNPANPAAHRATTGPEIWQQTGGRITHFVAGIGTGGTITGAGGYLKQVSNGAVTVVGADPDQSTYSGGDGSPYYVESVGHFLHPDTVDDAWPQSYDPDVIDRFERISDQESFDVARRLAREEGLLAGGSAGTALAAALRVARDLTEQHLLVVLLPDSGRSYLSKTFDENWLQQWGFGESAGAATVRDAWPGDLAKPPVAIAARTPLAVAAAELAQVDDLDVDDPVLVILGRQPRPAWPAVADVSGVLSLGEVRRVLATGGGTDATAGDHAQAALPPVGIGEPLAVARERVADRTAALVVRQGRAVGVVSRAQLLAGGEPGWTGATAACEPHPGLAPSLEPARR